MDGVPDEVGEGVGELDGVPDEVGESVRELDGVPEGVEDVEGVFVREGELVEVEDRHSAPTAYPAMPEFNENPVVALL